MTAGPHTPVMMGEVIESLAARPGALIVDATYGAGGYTRALLDSVACRVVALDRDAEACARARAMTEAYPGRLTVSQGRFGDMVELLAVHGIAEIDGVAFDLGVSSMQLDSAGRGFSFRLDGPLDMRMGPDAEVTAADLVNNLPEQDLARIIFAYGEERSARRVARAIIRDRGEAPIVTTARLADIIRRVVPPSRDGIDPATRTFQALRIEVNDELGELDRGLRSAEILLRPGGRLCVVALHSLEDRAVKAFLRARGGDVPRPSRHLPEPTGTPPMTFRLLHRRARRPSAAEVKANPRARSARLRAGERTAAAPWPSFEPRRRAA